MKLQMTCILMLASGLAMATPGYSGERNEKEAAIAEIKKLGGWVKVDKTSPQKPVVSVDLSGGQVTDAGLEHLKGLTKLRKLSVGDTKVTDEGVERLQQALPDCFITH